MVEGVRRRAAAGAAQRARFDAVPPSVERVSIAAGVTLVFGGVQMAVVALIVGGALALPVRLLQTALFALAPWVLLAAGVLVAVTGVANALLSRRRVSVPLLDQMIAGVHAVGANLALTGMVLSCWYGFPTAHSSAVGYRHAQLLTALVGGASVVSGWLHFRAFDRSVAKAKDEDAVTGAATSRHNAPGAPKAPGGSGATPGGGGGSTTAAATSTSSATTASAPAASAVAQRALSDSDGDSTDPARPRQPASPRRAPTLDAWTAAAHVVAPLLGHALVATALCAWFTAYASGPTPEFWSVVGDMDGADWSGLLHRAAVSGRLGGQGDRIGVGAV